MIEIIEQKILNNDKLTELEIKMFLDNIIECVKRIVKDDTFINKCDLVQGLVGRYLNKLNVKNYPCITNKCVMPNVVGHSFIVANICDDNYIIDPTFIQFALIDFDELYINHMRVKPKSPFYYAAKINKDITMSFISDGYIKLDTESAYLYGNCFYNTLTNISDDYKFIYKDGNKFINSFINGNEKLRKYDYDEIELSIDFCNQKNK